MKLGKQLLFIGALLLAERLPAAQAQYLTGENIKVVRHDKRVSRHQFYRTAERSAARFGRVFRRSYSEAPHPAESPVLSYDELPACSKSEVQLQDVYRHTQFLDSLDAVFYANADPAQVQKAQSTSYRTVAYDPELVPDARTGDTDLWQTLARVARVQCLPTRFRFTFIGSRRYMEFRTGDAAWQ